MKYLKIVLKVETDHFLDRESVLIFVGDLVLAGVEKFLLKTKFYEGEEPRCICDSATTGQLKQLQAREKPVKNCVGSRSVLSNLQ